MRFLGQRGQTLIEVVVATALLVLALTVMVSAVVKASANNRLSKERAIATRLAQEGIDYMRAYRDKQGWQLFKSLMVSVGSSTVCLPGTLDASNITVPRAEWGTFKCDSSHAGVTQSKTTYIRTATFAQKPKVPGPGYLDVYAVTVEVKWYFGSLEQSVKVTNQIAKIP